MPRFPVFRFTPYLLLAGCRAVVRERCTAREKKSRNEGQSQEFQRCIKANCFIGKFLIGANNQITIIIAQEAFNVKLDYRPVQTKSPNTCLLS